MTWAVLLLLIAAGPAAAQREPRVVVTVTPERATLEPGETLQFEAIADFGVGSPQDVTDLVEWRTTESSIARFSRSPGEAGLLTARGPGQVTVRATYEGEERDATGTAVLTVGPGQVVSLVTKPGTKRLEVGRPVQFEAKILYANGYQRDVTEQVVWSSSKPRIARVVNDGPQKGRVVPRRIGSVTITARDPITGRTNEDGLTQVLSPVVFLYFDTPTHVLGRGMSANLRVYGQRADGTRTTLTDDVEYMVSPPGIIDIVTRGDDAGRIKARRKGTARIRVKDPVRGLITPPRNAATVVVSGKLKELHIEPEPFRVGAGETRRPSIVGMLTTGLVTNDLRNLVELSVDDPTIARVLTEGNDNGRVEGLAVGTTTLRARDPVSGITSKTANNLVVRGRVTNVTVDPTSVVLGQGLPYPLRAYANRDDGTRSNISSSAEWTASPAGIVTVEDGLVRGVGDGTATVTATDPRTGFSASATVRVAGMPVSLNVAPNPFNVDLGETRRARAIAKLSSGAETSDLRAVVDWSVSDTSIARVGTGEPTGEEPELDRGEVLGLRAGRITLQAVEPLTGLRSTQTSNLRVGPQPGGGGPRPPPPPSPPPSGGKTLISVVVEQGNRGEVIVGQTVRYKARGRYSDFTTDNISDECEWSVDDPAIATVDNEPPGKGNVTGLSFDESTTVRVVCDGISASAPIAVLGDVVNLVVDPVEFEGTVLDTTRIRAIATYHGGVERDVTNTVLWFSTDPFVATVDAENVPGTVTLLKEGEALIVATTRSGHFALCLVRVLPPTAP